MFWLTMILSLFDLSTTPEVIQEETHVQEEATPRPAMYPAVDELYPFDPKQLKDLDK